MKTTTDRPPSTLLLLSFSLFLGALSLICVTHLSPAAAGQLDAQIAGMSSMGDAGSLDDLYSPDALFASGREGLEEAPLAGSPLSTEPEQSLVYAHDPSLESLPDEIAAGTSRTGMEAFLASRIDSKQDLEKGRLVADETRPGLYNDGDSLETTALVLIGSGAGAALVFLGFSRLRVRRHHQSGSRPSYRARHGSHRSRPRAF